MDEQKKGKEIYHINVVRNMTIDIIENIHLLYVVFLHNVGDHVSQQFPLHCTSY